MRGGSAGASSTTSRDVPINQPAAEPAQLDRWQVEELVDTVVARVERRVLDEMERRGLRRDPGVF
jgi:hypothetical protein